MYSLFPTVPNAINCVTPFHPVSEIICHLPPYHYFSIFFLRLALPCTHSPVSSSVPPDFHLLILKTPSSWQAVHSFRNLLRSSCSSISVRLAIDFITRNSFAVCSSVSIIYHLPHFFNGITSQEFSSFLFKPAASPQNVFCSLVHTLMYR